MILVDSNIPMYLVGADETFKDRATNAVLAARRTGEALVTDAEVFQEILHRYWAIRRPEAIGPAVEVLDAMTTTVFAIDRGIIRLAMVAMREVPALSARDAVHVGVMRRRGIDRILSFDGGFDSVTGISRSA